MLASHRILTCCLFLQGLVLSLGSPLIAPRGNSQHLKCTNAPRVVAGYYVDPSEAISPSSASATCQAQYEYLYCVPGTRTYIFFGVIKPTFQSNTSQYAATFQSTIEYIRGHIESSGDGPITDGLRYFSTTPSTGVQAYIEDANKHHLTWGVAGAAITGLNAWMEFSGNGYSDSTFQINDGSNWVGNGYIGALNSEGVCLFRGSFVPNTTCDASNSNDLIYGTNGGKLC